MLRTNVLLAKHCTCTVNNYLSLNQTLAYFMKDKYMNRKKHSYTIDIWIILNIQNDPFA